MKVYVIESLYEFGDQELDTQLNCVCASLEAAKDKIKDLMRFDAPMFTSLEEFSKMGTRSWWTGYSGKTREPYFVGFCISETELIKSCEHN